MQAKKKPIPTLLSHWFIVSMYIVMVLGISGCFSETKEEASQEPYFKITEYMNDEVKKYNTGEWVIFKEGKVNDKLERDTLSPKDSASWRNVFDLLYQTDINKPAYQGSFQISRDSSSDGIVTRYKTDKDDISIKEFVVRKSAGKVEEIKATLSVSNIVYNSEQQLTYFPDSLYIVSANQTVMTSDQESFYMKMELKKRSSN